jgi:hypothetical protein
MSSREDCEEIDRRKSLILITLRAEGTGATVSQLILFPLLMLREDIDAERSSARH